MWRAAILLAAAVLAGGVIAADKPKDAKEGAPVAAAGVVTDIKPDFVMLWVDGEDAPTKFAFAEGFDKNTFGFLPKCKGVFSPDRVQFTYIKGDDGNKVLTMKLPYKVAPPQPMGTVTGVVLFSNDFWVAVKPKAGPLDGYAISWPPGEMVARLKALQKGDTVTIKFHTDFERHRIETLQVVPAKPGGDPPAAKPPAPAAKVQLVPTTAPAATPVTSQPAQSLEEQARGKLQLAQLYIDNRMKDQAKEMLQNIIRLYPDTEAAKEAKARLAELGG
jgi:hypothetical protein